MVMQIIAIRHNTYIRTPIIWVRHTTKTDSNGTVKEKIKQNIPHSENKIINKIGINFFVSLPKTRTKDGGRDIFATALISFFARRRASSCLRSYDKKGDDECTNRTVTAWMRSFASKLRRTRSVIVGGDTSAILSDAGLGAASHSGPSNDSMMSLAPAKTKHAIKLVAIASHGINCLIVNRHNTCTA